MTTIKDAHAPATDRTRISTVLAALVRLEITHAPITGSVPAVAELDRAEFIRAIETELDGTWINHADLPKVIDDGRGVLRTDRFDALADGNPDRLRKLAHHYLAVARHLEANPPIDQADVDTLRRLMADAGNYGPVDEVPVEFARRLVEAGVRVPEAGGTP